MIRALLALVLMLLVAGVGFYFGRATAPEEQTAEVAPQPAIPAKPPETQQRTRVQEPLMSDPAKIEPRAEMSTPPPPATESKPVPDAGGPAEPRAVDLFVGLPMKGLKAADIHDTYDQSRGNGERRHEATDIMAPRGTPVLAVDNGIVKKLFESKPGGLTIYQFDPAEKYAYYYAHLDRYAPGLKEGHLVKRGDMIGYVGSTGNANPDAPHLHLAIFVLGPEKRWYEGTAVNPYPLLMKNFTNAKSQSRRR